MTFEGLPARQHLVKNGPEGEDIRAGVGFFSFELLRSHVLKRAEDGAITRQRLLRGLYRRAGVDGCLSELRQAEVEKHGPRRRQHDVARLQIAVDDTFAMSVVESVGDVDAVAERFV